MGMAGQLIRVRHFGSRGIAIMHIGHRALPDEGEETPQEHSVDQAAPGWRANGRHMIKIARRMAPSQY